MVKKDAPIVATNLTTQLHSKVRTTTIVASYCLKIALLSQVVGRIERIVNCIIERIIRGSFDFLQLLCNLTGAEQEDDDTSKAILRKVGEAMRRVFGDPAVELGQEAGDFLGDIIKMMLLGSNNSLTVFPKTSKVDDQVEELGNTWIGQGHHFRRRRGIDHDFHITGVEVWHRVC